MLRNINLIPGIKHIIAVASGKGGVGKSTIAVNVALALHQNGAKVGLLDGDIYGPSQPTMLGTLNAKPQIENRKFHPVEKHGLKTMSIGYLVAETSALVWRGPMIGKALQQMVFDTKWGDLDYLVIDLPPGTGDVQLTLCQKVPVSGALIVTTPQDVALSDARRACEMFQKMQVPILGVVENMSFHQCSQCGHQENIFGAGGAEKLSQEFSVPAWEKIPLDINIREMTDGGLPPVLQEPANQNAQLFKALVKKIEASLHALPKNYAAKFPKIVVEKE